MMDEMKKIRLKEKKDMMDEMKKIRKGQGGNMEFLENSGGRGDSKSNVGKRNAKDKKFGFGGKKKNIKKNDKRSTDDVSGFRPFNKGGAGGGNKGKPGISRKWW